MTSRCICGDKTKHGLDVCDRCAVEIMRELTDETETK